MTARTLKALRGSIRKWAKIVADTGTDEGHENCPLCTLFFPRCVGCPVEAKVLQGGCRGTPYDQYCRRPTRINAQRELAFLKSLLPKKGRK